MDKIVLHINGIKVEAAAGCTILEAAQAAGVDIPNLCHSELLKSYASCGICAVEIEGNPRLMRACAIQAADGMVINTNSPRAIANRKAALDLMLSDHRGDCLPPCQLACPAQTACQQYVNVAAEGDFDGAIRIIKDKIPVPASIGRVCPRPCEDACRRHMVDEPISIGTIKEFVADADMANGTVYVPAVGEPTGKKIAIVGGGPGGLSAAYFLRTMGHSAEIFDAMPAMGGMLRYGIPEYRLPRNVLDKEIDAIAGMGVTMHNNIKIGVDKDLATLKNDFDVVVVAVGAWKAAALGCVGEDSEGVFGGIDFLRDVSIGNAPNFSGKKIAVVGGGNTAMDAARTAVRLGADAVYNIYRRTREEMPAQAIEIAEAIEEGVDFRYLVNPVEIIAKDGKVSALDLQKMELGEPDEQGRRRPVAVAGAREILPVDIVIVAIGQNAALAGLDVLAQNRWGNIEINGKFQTNIPAVFAIGDVAANGAGIAIEAIADAEAAAKEIDAFLRGTNAVVKHKFLVREDKLTAEDFADVERGVRMKIPHRDGAVRNKDFAPVNLPLTEEAVQADAARCLKCGCDAFDKCKLIKYANMHDVAPDKFEDTAMPTNTQPINSHIVLNTDKCILCGLCVRICEEVVGETALGLMNRGFDAAVSLAVLAPPASADCANCEKCLKNCPTGALSVK
ncbi:MAG: FAD-dependent oxidoreductase [Defluviitaleaceae bacterium]|nr:FAD-dependent oxidoreductase [Defluviitaleaceae bacterium]